jgi:hypothetical protein
MEYIFKTKDEKESLRINKSLDMALLLWQIKVNVQKQALNASHGLDAANGVEATFDVINQMFEDYEIKIDELID